MATREAVAHITGSQEKEQHTSNHRTPSITLNRLSPLVYWTLNEDITEPESVCVPSGLLQCNHGFVELSFVFYILYLFVYAIITYTDATSLPRSDYVYTTAHEYCQYISRRYLRDGTSLMQRWWHQDLLGITPMHLHYILSLHYEITTSTSLIAEHLP